MPPPGEARTWTLLTAHGHVLVEIVRHPEARMRDISVAAGITERATQAIVADLEAAGYLTRTRVGRRNRYTVHLDVPFRHPAQGDHRVGPFLELLAGTPLSEQNGGPAESEAKPENKPETKSARQRRRSDRKNDSGS